MGMPITVELIDADATELNIDQVFEYFQYVDDTFSTYKPTSEVSLLNAGKITLLECCSDLRTIWKLAEDTKKQTNGYFDIKKPDGTYDPSGLVKGWAIHNAAQLLLDQGVQNFCVEAGGDIQVAGKPATGQAWKIGIRHPFVKAFNNDEIVKVVALVERGMATSGTYIRGQHIYNPHQPDQTLTDIVSLSVIGPNVYEADRFATAAFAMGRAGIEFIDQQPDLAGYMIDHAGIATMTTNFSNYTF